MQIRFPVVVEKDILDPKIKVRNKQNSGDDYLCQFQSLLRTTIIEARYIDNLCEKRISLHVILF